MNAVTPVGLEVSVMKASVQTLSMWSEDATTAVLDGQRDRFAAGAATHSVRLETAPPPTKVERRRSSHWTVSHRSPSAAATAAPSCNQAPSIAGGEILKENSGLVSPRRGRRVRGKFQTSMGSFSYPLVGATPAHSARTVKCSAGATTPGAKLAMAHRRTKETCRHRLSSSKK